MRRHRSAIPRRHARAGSAALKAVAPLARDPYRGEPRNNWEDLLIDPDDFDADAIALVTDVQRRHFDHEELAG